MKIAIAGGHSKKAPGASGYLDEYKCDRNYVARLKVALEEAGHTVVDCSNEKATANEELAEEVRLANDSKADWFIAIHFNASGGAGTGTECWYYTGNDQGYNMAKELSKNVSEALGLRDRGAKATTSLYVVKRTDMPAVLLEVCFVDNKKDAEAWNSTSWKLLTRAVTSAFGEEVSTQVKAPTVEVIASKTYKTVKDIQGWLNEMDKAGLELDGSAGPLTKKACVKRAQKACGATADGDFAVKSAKKWGGVVYGDTGAKVKAMQAMLILRGYSVGSCGMDGSCGGDTEKAIRKYQSDHNLTPDGSCGYLTSQSLFTW